jgi:hypothetical protein
MLGLLKTQGMQAAKIFDASHEATKYQCAADDAK